MYSNMHITKIISKTLTSFSEKIPFSNLLFEVGFSCLLLYSNTLLLTKVSSLSFFFWSIVYQAFPFSFYCFFPMSFDHILNPHIPHQKVLYLLPLETLFFFILQKINKIIINWWPATELEASPIDFSRFECSLKSIASYCLAT